MITMFIASTKIQLLWATARLFVTRFSPYLRSWGVLLQGNEEVGSVQDIILLFYVWCESRKSGGSVEFRILFCNASGKNLVFLSKILEHE